MMKNTLFDYQQQTKCIPIVTICSLRESLDKQASEIHKSMRSELASASESGSVVGTAVKVVGCCWRRCIKSPRAVVFPGSSFQEPRSRHRFGCIPAATKAVCRRSRVGYKVATVCVVSFYLNIYINIYGRLAPIKSLKFKKSEDHRGINVLQN